MGMTSRPEHIAIIMDGNGRWAKSHNRPRNFGHLKGARVARSIITSCTRLGIKYLTLYAFSTENWLRPREEVSFLMTLLERNIRKERPTLMANNIRFRNIGDFSKLPPGVAQEMQKTLDATAGNTGMTLTFAVNYGSRREVSDAVQRLAEKVARGEIQASEINEDLISKNLQSAFLPDPDLIIRTSGEFRLSNFLMWQAAYSEIYITSICWPDFNEEELLKAIGSYAKRERRFGQVPAPVEMAHK